MCLLIESIRLEDGKFCNVQYHQRRMEEAFRALFPPLSPPDLRRLLQASPYPRHGVFKCRVVYDDQSTNVSYAPYTPKTIRTLKVVTDNDIDYSHKFSNRAVLENLYARRGDCDDVLIIREGEVADSSFANIVFRKSGHWYTPAHPLLAGTMRQYLLEKGKIQAIVIRKEHIPTFETFRLINAMIGFDSPERGVADIIL